MQPGEAFVTRFSGTKAGPGGAVIDVEGTVGSIIDVRAPGQPPKGQHWIDEPQRKPITAGQVGQVFGVTLDDARPPNIYVTATSAFGLHRVGNNWMAGMWGQGGGPGTVYRLDAMNGYAPRPFAQITLNGRPNSGPALGNIAYDRYNKQIFVSDLETGMIHRLRAADGADLGSFDHGMQGRTSFTDAESGQQTQLPPIPFDPNSQPNFTSCPGAFSQSPQCWNFATTGRRIWGLAVQRNAAGTEVRLYYSVWSGPAFNQLQAWNQMGEDDKRNSIWSVRLGADGNFAGDVRREFILPDFFGKPQDIARAGYSSPVSDIAFAPCGPRPVMLIAERGGIRNLGLTMPNPFANPHEARALRYELDRNGAWKAVGRYDVGFYDRKAEGQPFMRSNCEGGIAFGLGYDATWVADPGKPDQFVWITGHSLCSPEGPCNFPADQQAEAGATPQPASQQPDQMSDDSQVHGVQGMAETAFEEVAPQSAFGNYPQEGQATPEGGPDQAYLIDTDINIDAQGNVIDTELTRNDATKIGDIAIYEMCEAPASYAQTFLLPPPVGEPPVPAHGRPISHRRYGSHDPFWSHNRFGSHNPYWSHNREGSHERTRSHYRYGTHDRRFSHRRYGSHERRLSHYRDGSSHHDQRRSHARDGSNNHDQRRSHARDGSNNHDQKRSHAREGSNNHDQRRSHAREGSNNHDQKRSHARSGSNTHDQQRSHARSGSNKTQPKQKFTPKRKSTPQQHKNRTPRRTFTNTKVRVQTHTNRTNFKRRH